MTSTVCSICGKESFLCSWEKHCFSCELKQRKLNKTLEIYSGKEDHTFQEEDVYCPYCGEIYDIEENEDYSLYEAEDDYEVECPECAKKFYVSVKVEYKFSTSRIEE